MDLAVLEIKTFDDPVLRTKAKKVSRVNRTVRKILDDMLETMRSAAGVGLAAPQVGISKRLIVVDVGDGPHFLVNPEIVSVSEEKETRWEGCLSWPGYVGEVERPVSVTVRGLDRDGHETWVEGRGLLARALLHEIDHLDGILFIDRAKTISEVAEEETAEVSPDSGPAITAVFMGSPDFAVPCLEEMVAAGIKVPLVITQPDRPSGRKRQPKPTAVKEAALRLGLNVLACEDVNAPDVVEKIRQASPDFIVVSAFGQKLGSEILGLPRRACLNVHPSLLPKYRGGNPIRRAIMAGEESTGVTIIYMSNKMDAGDICVQKTTTVGPDETFGTLEKRLAVLGAHALIEAIVAIWTGSAQRVPQDERYVSYARHLAPGEDEIDWTKPARTVHNLIRALSPDPGAVTFLGNERIKVLETRVLQDASSGLTPGSILGLEGELLKVQCGEGIIGILEVQPEGKRPMSGRSFFIGRTRNPGVFRSRSN